MRWRAVKLSLFIYSTDHVTTGITSCSNTRTLGQDKLSILDPERLNTSLHSSTTPSHFVGFRRFGTHPNPETMQILLSQHFLAAYLAPLSIRRKLWRLSCFLPSITTCFHPQTNTVSDTDTLPLLLCYN